MDGVRLTLRMHAQPGKRKERAQQWAQRCLGGC